MKKKWFIVLAILLAVTLIYSAFTTLILDKRSLLAVFGIGYVDKTGKEEFLYRVVDYAKIKDDNFYYQAELQRNPTNFDIPKDSIYPWMQPAFEENFFVDNLVDTPKKACEIALNYLEGNEAPINVSLDEEKGIWHVWLITRKTNIQYLMLSKNNGTLLTYWNSEGVIDGSPRWYDSLISGLMGYDYLQQ